MDGMGWDDIKRRCARAFGYRLAASHRIDTTSCTKNLEAGIERAPPEKACHACLHVGIVLIMRNECAGSYGDGVPYPYPCRIDEDGLLVSKERGVGLRRDEVGWMSFVHRAALYE